MILDLNRKLPGRRRGVKGRRRCKWERLRVYWRADVRYGEAGRRIVVDEATRVVVVLNEQGALEAVCRGNE